LINAFAQVCGLRLRACRASDRWDAMRMEIMRRDALICP
jgi:hypothetical protein